MNDLIKRLQGMIPDGDGYNDPYFDPVYEAIDRIEALERSCDRHAQMHENLVLQRDGLLNRVEALERELTDTECEANTLRGQLAEAQAVLRQAREALVHYDFSNGVPQQAVAAIDAVLGERHE